MEALDAVARAVGEGLRSGAVATRSDLQRAKREAALAAGLATMPSDRDVAARIGADLRTAHAGLLRTKPTRSRSGVAVVAVMSSPAACPHGKCTFCPGGPDVGVPQSYTGFEPSTMRAARLAYDPYRIVRTRLAQLARNGHPVSKVEAIVQGGTFPARDPAYQEWFVAGIYEACNAGPGEDGAWTAEAEWLALAPAERTARMADAMRRNEEAPCRVVGLTVETKPDWCLEAHVDGMLALGVTRVEVGLQALDDDVLRATHRGHTLQDSRDAMRITRDAGLKVCVHLMPGLPRPHAGDGPSRAVPRPPFAAHLPSRGGAPLDPDPDADVEDFRRLFEEPAWRPDMLKVYPTLVVQEGETTLKRQWQRGEYHPYGTAEAARVVALGKSFVPEWCRIQRVDRDIPTTHVEAGVANSNLRQLAQADWARLGLPPCRCIRCREAGRGAAHDQDVAQAVDGRAASTAPDPGPIELVRRDYEASGGTEAFLAFEDARRDLLLAFLRLRRAGPSPHRAEARVPGGAAFVRELKAYGETADVGTAPSGASFQHRGLGTRLLAEAERIAFGEWGVGRLLVVAGPGVKPYYRARGYVDRGPYVAKEPGRGVDLPARAPR
jgi:elongator complex protein 3